MSAAKRLRLWIIGVGLVAALPAFGSTGVSAAGAAPVSAAGISVRSTPFLPKARSGPAATARRTFHRQGSVSVSFLGNSDPTDVTAGGPAPAHVSALPVSQPDAKPLTTTSIEPDDLASFPGTAQASTIHSFGPDQEVTPPNEDIAAGLTNLVEVVNSTVEVFSRAGVPLGSADLNTFMRVRPGYHSSDPRAIYDPQSERFWITVTEVPNSGCPAAAPVLIAVSPTRNPLPLTGWYVYALPIGSGTLFGDQPGLGDDANTIVVTFNDFNCQLQFLGSEADVLQKSDLANRTGLHQDVVFTGGPFAPQPVQAFPGFAEAYVVTNESDCGVQACASPEAEVDGFQGTPESGGVFIQTNFVAMTATAVNDSTGFLPPADQPSPGPTLQTNDDRFLNAVMDPFGRIWTADGTSCQPAGDTVQRACLNYVEINVGDGTTAPSLFNQINDVGVEGADLYYPAVSSDANGNLFTVFDESSTTMFPTVLDATMAQSASAFSPFQTLHTSATYYNGDQLFSGACDSEGCRWGDYSGISEDASNAGDVWVVSGSEDGSIEGTCATAHACWNTHIDQLTLMAPVIHSMTPGSGPVVGGDTVTVAGYDFAADTTFTAEIGPSTTLPIPIHIINPEEVTFVTPSADSVGGSLDIASTDSLGTGSVANLYQYVDLANYVPINPDRILDTRSGGGALGPGAVRTLQVTGVGTTPVPFSATAVVLNVTEVNGTAPSLLTVFPAGATRPNVSNLNFAPHTVIANLVTATLAGGQVNIYNAVGTVNVLVDVEGYFTPQPSTDFQGLFHPIKPLRVCDTRSTSPTPACKAHGVLGTEAAMVVNVTGTGAGAIPADGTAGAAVLNVTGVAGSVPTYLSVLPTNSSGGCTFTGSHAPPVSTINLPARGVGANRVMVELGPATTGGPDTSVCVYNAAGSVNVILDANGWFGSSTAASTPQGYQYQALIPVRICDTRVGSAGCSGGAIAGTTSRLVGVAGHDLVPAVGAPTVVVAVIANLTAIAPTAATYLTLYPSETSTLQAPPNASDLNVNAGETLPNLAVVQLDTTSGLHNGFISLFNSVGSVNAVIDLEGWFQ